MATHRGPWKRTYDQFIDPNYKYVEEVSGVTLSKEFQAFADSQRDKLPDTPPSDPHLFNTHMTQCYLHMEKAKDHFLRASLAMYATRNSCEANNGAKE